MTFLLWLAALAIGGCGAVLRLVVDGAMGGWIGRDFPFGTLAINVSGAFVLGLLTGLAIGSDEALLAGTAAVGSYTTFSTWMFETQRLAEERRHLPAAANIVISVVVGLGAAALGRLIGVHA